MSNLDDNYYLVRKDTSEVVDETNGDETFVKLRAGDVILRREGLENRVKLSPVNMRFGKSNLDVMWDIYKKYPIFFKMIQYLQYQSGKLVFSNGREINRKNLAQLCGVSKNTVDRQIKAMINDDVIKAVKSGRCVIYYLNPYIVHKGSMVYDTLLEMFKNSSFKESCVKLPKGDKYDGIRGIKRT